MRLLFLLAIAATLTAKSPFAFHELDPTSLQVTENGKPVFVYNYGMVLKEGIAEKWRRSSYIHPLYAPDGTVVTDDFPADHLHHRGVFWAWPVVTVDGATYDPWALEGMHDRFVRWIARDAGNDAARLTLENGWYVGEKKVLKETVEIVAHPVVSASRTLDLTLTFEALEKPLAVSGSRQDKKGYGGFGVRFASRENTVIRSDKGIEEEYAYLVRHPWAALEGNFQGHFAAMRVDLDPANPDFPNGWHPRKYGYLGVSFPGLETYVFEPGRPVALKYRLTVSSENKPK